MGDIRIEFDADEMAEELSEVLIDNLDTEALVNRIQRNGDWPSTSDNEDLWYSARSQLESMPQTHSGRCELGVAFESAVIKVMASAFALDEDDESEMNDRYSSAMSTFRSWAKRQAAEVVHSGTAGYLPEPRVPSYRFQVIVLDDDKEVSAVYGTWESSYAAHDFARESAFASYVLRDLAVVHTD